MQSIYITDLDHTFLRSDLSISDYSKKVWNQKAKQSILTVATARSFSKSLEFLSGLKLNAPMILLDGSMVVTPQKKLIDIKTIDKELADAIIDAGATQHIYPFVIALQDMQLNEKFLYPSIVNSYQKAVLENYKNDPRLEFCKEIRAMEMNLKLVYYGEYQTLATLEQHLKDTFGDILEYKLSPEKYSNGYFFTVLHKEADKSHAVELVCDYIDRDITDVTVFGDSLNDIGMFERAGTSVAVANALDEVKMKANITLPYSNDDDAVAKYLASQR